VLQELYRSTITVLQRLRPESREPSMRNSFVEHEQLRSSGKENLARDRQPRVEDRHVRREVDVLQFELSRFKTDRLQLEDELAMLKQERVELVQMLSQEQNDRKRLARELQELKGRIQVYCQLEPCHDLSPVLTREDAETLKLESDRLSRRFGVDGTTAEDGLELISSMAGNVFRGYNVSFVSLSNTGPQRVFRFSMIAAFLD
jgi:hypothetical protein